MRHRLVLFKWVVVGEKEILRIVDHYADSLGEAKNLLEATEELEYDIAKIFLGDALLHTKDIKNRHHGHQHLS